MDDATRLAQIEKQLKVLPDKPGVYVIFDSKDKVIYVGKAKVLSNRVRTHFAKSTDFSKSRVIRERGARIEVHQVTTENEALLLEYNMIQEHQPMLNERWKDGKTYPYLEVTTGETWPRFVMTRDRDTEHSVYLGPFSDVGAVKRSLRYVLKLFPVADCRREIHLGDADDWAKTCIRRRTKQCMRPCEIPVDHQEYQDNVEQVIKFMEGKLPEVLDDVKGKMKTAADALEFERAATYRDIMKSISRTMQRQNVFLEGVDDGYVIVQEENKHEFCITIQKIEDDRVVRRDSNTLSKDDPHDLEDFIMTFLITILGLQDAGEGDAMHSENIIVATDHAEVIMSRLSSFGFNPSQPDSDIDRQLVEMAKNHARRHLQRRLLVRKDKGLPSKRVEDLRQILEMDVPPFVIDTFDVSTLMGTNNVASCVRFHNGKPLKKGYRRFKIRTVEQQDDFASMYEAVYRRYRDVENGEDPKGLPVPDLIIIDGGPEQLKRGKQALRDNGLAIPIVGLAKREEEIYFPDREDPINEDNNRPGMLLITSCRDEAHRFAITYQRKLRQKEGLTSILDQVSGIGPKRRKSLLRQYKTVASIAKESSETLSQKIGIPKNVASDVITACRAFTTQEAARFGRKRRRG